MATSSPQTANSRLPAPSSRWRLWLLGYAIWAIIGLLAAAQRGAWAAYNGRPVEWLATIWNSLADWGTCGVFTPGIFWVVERFPIRGRRWWSSVPVHFAASIGFVLLKVSIYAPLLRFLNAEDPRLGHATFLGVLSNGFFYDFLGYWAAAGVVHAFEYYRESREREVEAARLDGALRAAELETLRAQLQPHFLFNTLQSISTLLHRDPTAADRMLADLSDLLRASLRHTAAQEVPLRDELDFLERYLSIMRVRFGDRLVIEVDAPPEVHEAMVPSLVLQPLAENAIRHGMADRADRGRVAIRAQREGESLRLEVADDGPGMSAGPTVGEGNGIGLANTRERLRRLYGAGCGLETLVNPGVGARGGLTVRLTIPLRFRAGGATP